MSLSFGTWQGQRPRTVTENVTEPTTLHPIPPHLSQFRVLAYLFVIPDYYRILKEFLEYLIRQGFRLLIRRSRAQLNFWTGRESLVWFLL